MNAGRNVEGHLPEGAVPSPSSRSKVDTWLTPERTIFQTDFSAFLRPATARQSDSHGQSRRTGSAVEGVEANRERQQSTLW